MKKLFISDLHLGDGSKADDFGKNDKKFIRWVKKLAVDEIYLIGDIYELWQFKMKRIKKAHKIVCDLFSHSRVHYVSGNHDYKLLGKTKITLKVNNLEILITHGHQADKRVNNPFMRGLVWVLGIVERIPGMKWVDNPDKWSKKKNKSDIKTEDYVINKLMKYDVVICGHTHKLLMKKYSNVIGTYINTGTCMHGKFEGVVYNTVKDEFMQV